MIKVEMTQTEKGYSMSASGHAGYAPKGQDIVCAAVSVLLQTLANKVEDAARQGQLESSCVQHGETFVVQAQPRGGMNGIMVAAWYDFVESGLSELAGQYPDHVELYINDSGDGADVPEKAMNLQKFAEGGDGGASEGGAEAAAPAVQEPALRPAQERLARRSGALKSRAAGAEKLPQPPAGGSPLKEGASDNEGKPAETEKPEEPAKEPKTEKGYADRKREFGELVKNEYNDIFNEVMQHSIDVAGDSIRNDPKVVRLTQALAKAYGVGVDDLDGLIDAVENGKVKDDAYYETLAAEKGISVKTARELDRMEGELHRANAEKQRAEQMRLAAEHQQRVAAVQAQWQAEAEQLQQKYPSFQLGEVLNNPAVADMIRRGVGLEAAYRAAYFDQLMENQVALTAKQVENGVTARIQQRSQRPTENGVHPGGAAETKVDVEHMTRAQRAELARRARRGERIVL